MDIESDQIKSFSESFMETSEDVAAPCAKSLSSPAPLIDIIEALLFIADGPLKVADVEKVFLEEDGRPNEEVIIEAMGALQQKYKETSRAISLEKRQGGYQLITQPNLSIYLQRYYEMKPIRLSRSAMETLAILAYKGPLTRAEIDTIRGTDSSHSLKVLIEKNLVEMAGKSDFPGRPVLYQTTKGFLELVGVESLLHLPPLSELEYLEGHSPSEGKKETLENLLTEFIQSSTSEGMSHTDIGKEEFYEVDRLLQEVEKKSNEIISQESSTQET